MSLKIFIVEDDEVYSHMLDFQLKKSGFERVTVFNSGEDCIDHIAEKPNLLLLDFSLTGLNGLDTLHMIKKKSPKTEVIVLTGLDNEKVAKECKEAGALDFLSKQDESLNRIIDYATKLSTKKESKSRISIILLIIVIALLALVLSQII